MNLIAQRNRNIQTNTKLNIITIISAGTRTLLNPPYTFERLSNPPKKFHLVRFPNSPAGRNDPIDVKEERLVWVELDSLPDDPRELSDADVEGYEELPLVQRRSSRSRHPFDDHLGKYRKSRDHSNGRRVRCQKCEKGRACSFRLFMQQSTTEYKSSMSHAMK